MKSNKQGLKQQSLSCSQNAASLALEFPLLALIHLLLLWHCWAGGMRSCGVSNLPIPWELSGNVGLNDLF